MTVYVYEFALPGTARRAVRRLVSCGVDEAKVSLVMRAGHDRHIMPAGVFDARAFIDVLRRGLAIGGVAGLFAWVAALVWRDLGMGAVPAPAPLASHIVGTLAGGVLASLYCAWQSVRRGLLERRREGGGVLLVLRGSADDNELVRRLMLSEAPVTPRAARQALRA